MPLAIFDLDNTLIAGDSDYSWGQFLVRKNRVNGEYYQRMNEQFYRDYEEGNMDIFKYLHFALEPLAAMAPEELAALHREFMATVIAPMWLPKAVALIQHHRAAGDYLLAITSTNRFVAEPICQQLGLEDLIATELEIRDDRYTGAIIGEPSFREGKVRRLRQWLEETGFNLDHSCFYSDSINDLPLLEQVDRPVAVDPDNRLRQCAQARGWEIISLRA